MSAHRTLRALPAHFWLKAAAVILLQGLLKAAGQVIINSAYVEGPNEWELTLSVDHTLVKAQRGQDAVLTYTAHAKPQTNPKVKGTVSVTARQAKKGFPPPLGKCVLSAQHNTFPVGLRVTIDGGTPTRQDINFALYCNPPIIHLDYMEVTCSHAPFEVTAPGLQPVKIDVAPLWQDSTTGAKSAVSLCSAGGNLPVNAPATGSAATVTQTLQFPMWNPVPTQVTSNQVAGVMPKSTYGASSGRIATVDPPSYDATWTLTVTNIQSCVSGQELINTVTLTPDGGLPQESNRVAVTFDVQCDVSLAIRFEPVLRVEGPTVWSHTIQAIGPSDVALSWGSATPAVVLARVNFQRSITPAIFRASGQLYVTNNGAGLVRVQSLHLQCPWASSIPVLCSGAPSFNVAAGDTSTCQVNEHVPGDWGADTSQDCTITAEVQGSPPTTQPVKLDFKSASSLDSGSQGGCARWSVTCSQPVGGTNNWQATVTSEATDSQQLCGDKDTTITWKGTWTGPGDQPGDCGTPASATCKVMSDGTQVASAGPPLKTSATPTNCPPAITINVAKTRIAGTFAWGITAAVAPAAQEISLGGNGTARYTVVATRDTANGFTAAQYVVEGAIILANGNNAALPFPTVVAVSGNERATAVCPASPGGISPRSAAPCTFQLVLKEPSSGSIDAEVTMPGSAIPAHADGPAQFNFDHAERSQLTSADNAASSACVLVSMTLQANSGMSLQKLNDLATPLPVDGSTVRICNTTRFEFDVQHSPQPPLEYGTKSQPFYQQVLGTATLRGEGTSTMEPKSAVATANIGVYAPAPATTDDALVNPVPANNTPDHPINAVAKDSKTEFASVNDSTPTTAANDTSSSEADVTVTLDDVSTKLIADAVWSLKVLPVGMPGDKATMAASAGLNMTFNVHYTQTVEKVTGYYGTLRITNHKTIPVQVDSVRVELVNDWSRTTVTEAEAPANCSVGTVSSTNLLQVAAGASAECSYLLKSKIGGKVLATITTLDEASAVPSKPQPVMSLYDTNDNTSCAKLVTGLGATTLVPGGRVLANNGEQQQLMMTEVCGTGSQQVVYTIGASRAPCGTYPFLAMASLTPPADSTAPLMAASAAVDITLTSCSSTAAAPEAASISQLEAYKARLLQWRVKMQTSPLPGNVFTYVPGEENTMKVNMLYSRHREGQHRAVVSGVATAATGGAKLTYNKTQIVFMPLSMSSSCGPLLVKPNCATAQPAEGPIACKFKTDNLTVAPGIVLPLMYTDANQDWPLSAKPLMYHARTYGDHPLARCARLTDTHSMCRGPCKTETATGAGTAAVTKIREVNRPPARPMCVASYNYTYELQFSGVECGGGAEYVYSGLAKAAPNDTAGAVATASLDFTVKC